MAFVLLQIVCQAALLFDALLSFRIIFRSAAFLMSLALLVFLPENRRAHPARKWALASMGVLTLAFGHPETFSSPLAAIAQWTMNLAIIAPIFWVNRLRINSTTITKLSLALWIFHTASAFVGVLQAYYPGQFQPALSTVILNHPCIDGLKVRLANGATIFRPMGLTDYPGGAGTSGVSAILLGLGVMLSTRAPLVRLAVVASIAVSLFCIYLSMIRSCLVVVGVCVIVAAVALIRRGDVVIGVKILATTAVLGVASFTWAVTIGGAGVEKRFTTLIAESPDEVYHKNRGIMLTWTFKDLLPKYPLGAGLGKWGMMNYYFGDPNAPEKKAFGVEIQWTGWLFDGGAPLILCFSLALLQTTWTAWRLATSPAAGSLSDWSVVLLTRDIGALALTFSYTPFISQGGMEFWCLNAAVYAAFVNSRTIARFATAPKNGSGPVVRELQPPLTRLALKS